MSTSCRKAPVWTRAIALLAAFTFMLPAAIGQDSGTAVESSTIKGKITTGPKKTPVPGATILIYHLATATIHRSAPTDEKGHYEVSGLEHGYYDLAVESPDGLYVGNQVVNLLPGGKMVSNFNLEVSGTGESSAREFPGSDQPTTGTASFLEKSFWMKPKGIAIWVGGSAVAAALLLSGGSSGSGNVVSGSSPP